MTRSTPRGRRSRRRRGIHSPVTCPEDPEAARDAIEHLAALRTSYVDDRAYRLLTAGISPDEQSNRPGAATVGRWANGMRET